MPKSRWTRCASAKRLLSAKSPLRHDATSGALALLLFILSCVCLSGVQAVESSERKRTTFSSGPNKVSLVELYTSEGCSSCPPADRWLSALGSGEALWKNVVPVAFHVSYWDRLGWPDRFAQRQFDRRQRTLAARADAGVYTPGVFKDGTEFRDWRRVQPESVAAAASPADPSGPDAPGNLSLSHLGGNQWEVTYQPATNQGNPRLEPAKRVFAAVLGNNLSNQIRRGENAGKRLDHDFVVLQLETAALQQTLTAGQATPASAPDLHARFTLDTTVTDFPAVAAWVINSRGTPVQSVGGAL